MNWNWIIAKSLLKEMATHSSILAWRIPWQATVHGVVKSWTRLNNSTSLLTVP